MLGYSNTPSSRRSDPIFSPITNTLANSFNDIPKLVNEVVTQTVIKDLKTLRETVKREYPELAESIDVVIQKDKLSYVMSGSDALDVEYGNENIAPRAYLRKAANRTADNIQMAITKAVSS